MKALAAALHAFQKEPPAIHSDSTGNFSNKFASLAGIVEAVRPTLNANGLVVVQQPCAIDGNPGLRTTLIHAESGEQMEDTMPLVLDKPNMQGFGSALTYARRQSLLAILNLVADADDDASAASRPAKATTKAAPATSPSLPAGAAESNGDASELRVRLLEAATKLDAFDATHAAIEVNEAEHTLDPDAHVAWLARQVATAEENVRVKESPFKEPKPKPEPKKKSPLTANQKRVYAKFKAAEEAGQLDKAGFDEFMAQRGYELAKLNEDQARDVEAFIANQEIPF